MPGERSQANHIPCISYFIFTCATVLGQALAVSHPHSYVNLFTGASALDLFKQSILFEAHYEILNVQTCFLKHYSEFFTGSPSVKSCSPGSQTVVSCSVMKCVISNFDINNGPRPEVCKLFKILN